MCDKPHKSTQDPSEEDGGAWRATDDGTAAARALLPSDDASGGFLRVRSRAAYHGSSRG